MTEGSIRVRGAAVPWRRCHTLVAGSGSAGLAAAVRLYRSGVTDLAIVTESLKGGTSFNTGSDKQTYYRLSTSGPEADSPHDMARSLFDGGATHGDIALAEASGSTEAFFNLVSLGVPFPRNRYGGYVGYKTDHDPARRGISIGPYTSKKMVQALLAEVRLLGIPVFERREIVRLLIDPAGPRAFGFAAMDRHRLEEDAHGLELWLGGNVVFALGGPGGLYSSSVYPAVHNGGIGLALEAGAEAVNLTESQFGLASIRHRWNVSGTYQQVIPRYFSTDSGGGDEQEFLNPWFDSMGELAGRIFLKGYQWPFDPGKVPGRGSSIIDILVYHEREVKGRRVFMDFRENPRGDERTGRFDFGTLEPEARHYLEKSGALFGTPIARLEKMNPIAIRQYLDHGIDLAAEPLEVAVCAQHNNGGLAVDLWWESTNIARLFPVGEVAGTHGVYRPGGSALNAGQVGALRAAMKIAFDCPGEKRPPDHEGELGIAGLQCTELLELSAGLLAGPAENEGETGEKTAAYLRELQHRMSREAAHIRNPRTIGRALEEAMGQIARFAGLRCSTAAELPRALMARQLAIAHGAYIAAIDFYANECSGGSRGSSIILDPEGEEVHPRLKGAYRFRRENHAHREFLISTLRESEGTFSSRLIRRKPLPDEDFWFETVWRDFREGTIFNNPEEGA
jgi:succinate dehydrogenase/fumarate reductase flavoprotein subunit